jgi:IclR family transcriptional regulator, acetate operon repressor
MSKIVERTLDLLELFAKEKRPLTLSDIAHLLKIPLSSCYDVVRAMLARGYVYELAPRAGYYPTSRLYMLGKEIGNSDPVLTRAELLLRSLRDKLDESVLLAKVSGLTATYLLAFEPTHPLRMLVQIGDKVRSLHATSAGKALLGGMDERALKAFFKTAKLAPLTKNTITSKTALLKNIEIGQKRRWYLNSEESQNGVTTVSSTFRWNSSTYIVTIAGPSARLDQKLDRVAELLTGTCELMERQPAAPLAASA